MLDALAALVEGDVRKTILYSAIAVEARATEVLDKAYEAAKLARAPRHRIVDIADRGGQVSKDPIFDALPDKFRTLLHERPLYLEGRSLLLENRTTYDRALKLYTTRSKLAHRGTHAEEDGECFPLTRDGAERALRAAIDTLRWFGDPGPYVISGEFVTPCD